MPKSAPSLTIIPKMNYKQCLEKAILTTKTENTKTQSGFCTLSLLQSNFEVMSELIALQASKSLL